jgi:N-acetylglucosamine kinase-like BadF-type ATPase
MGPHEITDATLARARRDPAFKQELLTAALERLLAALYRRQHYVAKVAKVDPALPRQLREGAQLAARLADIIRAIDEQRARASADSDAISAE